MLRIDKQDGTPLVCIANYPIHGTVLGGKNLQVSGDVPGAPGQVRIGIWAVGQEMRLFLNGRYQFTIANSNYPTGTVGAFVNAAGKTAVVVNFSDLQIQEVNYSLPTKTPRP